MKELENLTGRIGVVSIAPQDIEKFCEAMGESFTDLTIDCYIVSVDNSALVRADMLNVDPAFFVAEGIPAEWLEKHGQAVCTFSKKLVGTAKRVINGIEFDTEVAGVGAVHVDANGTAWTVVEIA